MDCNIDEATRAREMAEKKLMEKDIFGAKRYASKAKELYPGLDGLFQLQQTLEIHTAYERRINREVDWYGVLGVDPRADDQTMKKRYRKLVLALHPDKNKTVGAEEAFKIVSEAWRLLSDTVDRANYDKKLNMRPPYGNVTGPNTSAGIHGMCNFNSSASARNVFFTPVNLPTHSTPAGNNLFRPVNLPSHSTYNRPNGITFWTVCKPCKIKFEYLDIYRNQTLMCPTCRNPFLAVDVPPPDNFNIPRRRKSNWQNQQRGFPAGHTSPDSGNKFTPAPKMPSPGSSHVDSMSRENNQKTTLNVGDSRCMGRPARVAAQHMHGSQLMMRGHDDTINVVDVEDVCNASHGTNDSEPCHDLPLGEGEKLSKKARLGDKDAQNQKLQSVADSGACNVSRKHLDKQDSGKLSNPDNSRCNSEARNVLAEKAKMEIRKKLQVLNEPAANTTLSSGKVDGDVEMDIPTVSVPAGSVKAKKSNTSSQPRKCPISSGLACAFEKSEGPSASSLMSSDSKGDEVMEMSVPDPDFYDFDKDRIENVFAKNQVWAVYDDKDGMPRFYLLIHEVLSRKPFKVRISWLNSKSNSEFGQLNWGGFAKTFGDFRTGKREIYLDLNSFSHRVKWSIGFIRGAIRIFPQKGDIWALYRNWSSEWNEKTLADVIQQYDMVIVIDDFNEEQGVSVAPLVKVAGFRSVFQQMDSTKVYRIPRAEMFRFSHQVASYTLTGQEAENAPKGCVELDTAAMPLELLHIITAPMEREESKQSQTEDAISRNAVAYVSSRKLREMITEPGKGSKQSGRGNANAKPPIIRAYSRKRREMITEPGKGSEQSGKGNANAKPPITRAYSRKRKARSINGEEKQATM